MISISLLGPQRKQPTVHDTMESLGLSGPLAVITSGWEERETEDTELTEHAGRETVNLRLFQRSEEIFERDPELLEGLRRRHDRLRKLQDLYRLRLEHALEAARELVRRDESSELLLPEVDDALATLHQLDDHHLERVREIHADFEQRWRLVERDDIGGARQDISQRLDECGGLAIAGGHVVVLLNRLRLFDVLPLARDKPIIAWSAGAMVLTDEVVVFHDSPPQGRGNPEVLEAGLGLCPDVVALPHARRRLLLQDPTRVSVFARRFLPAVCVALDENSRVDWDGTHWRRAPGTRWLAADGSVHEEISP